MLGCAGLYGSMALVGCGALSVFGWGLFVCLFFNKPHTLLLDACRVCWLVCFLNRKYSVKDTEEHGENESINH